MIHVEIQLKKSEKLILGVIHLQLNSTLDEAIDYVADTFGDMCSTLYFKEGDDGPCVSAQKVNGKIIKQFMLDIFNLNKPFKK
jgi:hypothetical protein